MALSAAPSWRLATELPHGLATHQHVPGPWGGPIVPPLAPEVGPYPSSLPLVLKGRGSGPARFHPGNFRYALVSQGDSTACFPFISRLLAYFCN